MTQLITTQDTMINYKNSDGDDINLSIKSDCDLITGINDALFLAGFNERISFKEPSEKDILTDDNGDYALNLPKQNIINSIQQRPGLFIDRTYKTELLQQLMMNEVNLFKNKGCTEINVSLNSLGSVEISNNGIGLDDSHFNEETCLLYTEALPYVYPKDRVNQIETFGTNCMINVATNALSESFYFKTTNEDFTYSQSFKNGILSSNLLKEKSKGKLGTQIIFTPNKNIFTFQNIDNEKADHAESIAFLYNIAMLNSGLIINLTESNGEKTRLHYKNGMKSLLKHKFTISDKIDVVCLNNSDPINNESIDIAFANTLTDDDFEIVSYFNDFETRNGGGHVDGVVMALKDLSEHLGINKQLTGIKAIINLNTINYKISSHHDRLITRNEKNRVSQKLKKIIQ
jgi:DNA gyrase/topoisomerase IV subunit B